MKIWTIVAVINSNNVTAKIKPEKYQACAGFEPITSTKRARPYLHFHIRGSKYDIHVHNHSKQSAKDISAKGGKFLPYITLNARLDPYNDRMGTHQISSVVETLKIREPITFEYVRK